MCELFAINSTEKLDRRDYMKPFIKESEFHPHGWGLANLDEEDFNIKKEPIKASSSSYLKQIMKKPFMARNMLFHIRYATIGSLVYNNCHPFQATDCTGRKWLMMHNGTIFDFDKINKYKSSQTGTTDSERVFMYIIEEYEKKINALKRELSDEERFKLLDDIILEMSKNNKLNMMLYDGEILYIHINYADSMYYLKKDNSLIFCTTKLTDEDWTSAPFKQLFACKNGEIITKGTKHNNEYIESDANKKFLKNMLSTL